MQRMCRVGLLMISFFRSSLISTKSHVMPPLARVVCPFSAKFQTVPEVHGVVPLRGRLERKEAPQRFQPFGLSEVVVHQAQAKGPELRFVDAQHHLFGTSRQGRPKLLERAR